MSYTFRPATRADLPMLREWLETPDVVRWWGDPAEQFALLEENLDEPEMTMLIVSFEGSPFGYAQHCALHHWPQPYFEHLPADTRAIDALIGVPAMVGKGHGSAFLRLLATELIAAGAPMVAIDPDIANARAGAAYGRAGFVEDGIVESGEGPVAGWSSAADAARSAPERLRLNHLWMNLVCRFGSPRVQAECGRMDPWRGPWR